MELSRQEEYAERLYTLLSDPAISEDAKAYVVNAVIRAEDWGSSEMESEMSAERISGDMVTTYFGGSGEGVRLSVEIAQSIRQAEERGYQRGKSEQVVLRSQSQHGFLSSRTDEETGIQTDRCVCGALFSCDMFEVNEALNDHVRQAWAEQSVPCEWEDLKGLEGRELRERLGSRAQNYKSMASYAYHMANIAARGHDRDDMIIMRDLVDAKSQACEVEASRLWEQHLHELTTWYIEEDPSYVVLLEKAGNAQYAHIIVERAAARRARDAGLHIPTIEELAMEVQQEVS